MTDLVDLIVRLTAVRQVRRGKFHDARIGPDCTTDLCVPTSCLTRRLRPVSQVASLLSMMGLQLNMIGEGSRRRQQQRQVTYCKMWR